MAGAWRKQDAAAAYCDYFVALRVRARAELAVAGSLAASGVETLCPVHWDRKQLCDRTKLAPVALFPCYIFSRYQPATRLTILKTPGVQEIVSNGLAPLPLEEGDLEVVRRLAAEGVMARPYPYLSVGERVRIHRGVMAGLEGRLVRLKNAARVVVSIDTLQRSVLTEISEDSVTRVTSFGGKA